MRSSTGCARRSTCRIGTRLQPRAVLANVERTPKSGTRVAGTVFEITDAELAVTDAYEQDSEYGRVMITLASGRDAWVYLSKTG